MIEFNQESVQDVLPEVLSMLRDHWEEVARNKDKQKLSVDFDRYTDMEEEGVLVAYVLREDGVAKGYSTYFLNTHLRYDMYCALNDVIYVSPELRHGSVTKEFIEYCEKDLKSRGVENVMISMKSDHRFESLLKSCGYGPLEVSYSKYIGE